MTQLGLESVISRQPALLVTQSDIAAFKKDRLDWFLKTYLGLRPRDRQPYGALHLGTRVHTALERHYLRGEDLLEAYRQLVGIERAELEDSGRPFDNEKWSEEAELGRVMLEGFVDWREETGFDTDFRIFAVEDALSHVFDIDGTAVELRGKLDARARSTFSGMQLILDWKTAKSISQLIAQADNSEQLLTYATLEYLNNPDAILQGALYVILRKTLRGPATKPPYYAVHEVHFSQGRIATFGHRLSGVLADYVRIVAALDAGIDFRRVVYPTPNFFATFSAYSPLIMLLDEGIAPERMIADRFEQIDPHERYNADARPVVRGLL